MFPSILAFVTGLLGFRRAFKFFAAVTIGIMVKETQIKGFAYAVNALSATAAYCLADWHKAYDLQLTVPLLVGAILHCRVSEACPDVSIQNYADVSGSLPPRRLTAESVPCAGTARSFGHIGGAEYDYDCAAGL